MNKRVKIGPQVFDIIFKDGLFDGEKRLDGQIKFSESNIFLDANLDSFASMQTLWHEIIHGISTQAGLELSEKQVDVLAYGILDVLSENGWLTK